MRLMLHALGACFFAVSAFSADVLIRYDGGEITTDQMICPWKLKKNPNPEKIFKFCRDGLFKQFYGREPGKGDEKKLARVAEALKRLNLLSSCRMVIDKHLRAKYMNAMITPEVEMRMLEKKRRSALSSGLDKEVAAIKYVGDFTSGTFTKKQEEAYKKFLPQNKYSLESWKSLCLPKNGHIRKWKLKQYANLKAGKVTKREKEYYFSSHSTTLVSGYKLNSGNWL